MPDPLDELIGEWLARAEHDLRVAGNLFAPGRHCAPFEDIQQYLSLFPR